MSEVLGTQLYTMLADEFGHRAARAVVSKLGPISDPLRKELFRRLDVPVGTDGGFLSEPVLEATFGWRTSPSSMQTLSGSLLDPALVEAMDAAENPDVRFPRDRHPFTHQEEAWRVLLADQVQSAVVSSGTGSGKTECFLVPILSSLLSEARTAGSLKGVRALFLYPLNALINSQRERLSGWTRPLKGKVRFCLYNGETPNETQSLVQQTKPEEVLSRRGLRAEPPPLLVTNATMLEYLLVRHEDQPILQRSEGMLRWVVLDEAHTYIGSQAAEVALLLRRVLHAFGVQPRDVRFVATSATLSGTDGDAARRELRRFLADIAGTREELVQVVEGKRFVPPLPSQEVVRSEELPALEALRTQEPAERFRTLARSPRARGVRALLAQGQAQPLSALAAEFRGRSPEQVTEADRQETLRLLDVARSAALEDNSFLPLRGHFFHRTQRGVWACFRSDCSKREGALTSPDWPFGRIYFERREHCECGARVFEMVLCSGCGAEYLLAREVGSKEDTQRRFVPQDLSLEDDSLDEGVEGELENEEEEALSAASTVGLRLLGRYGRAELGELKTDYLEPKTGVLVQPPGGAVVRYLMPDEGALRCGRCREREQEPGRLFRALRAGGPFFLGVAIPTLLEHVPVFEDTKRLHPFEGRRLITFTDSRQGSAQFALGTQLEAERNRVRTLLYHKLQADRAAARSGSGQAVEQLRQEIATLEPMATNPVISGIVEQKKRDLARLSAPAEGRLSWDEAAQVLLQDTAVKDWMYAAWQRRAGEELKPKDFVRFLLFRELIRRPKRQSSLETLGLVAIRYPAVDRLEERDTPVAWRARKLPLQEWRNFLKVAIDFIVRGRTAVTIDDEFLRWMGVSIKPKFLLGPNATRPPVMERFFLWPLASSKTTRARLPLLLANGLGLSIGSDEDRAFINELLQEAWATLLQLGLLEQFPDGRKMNLSRHAELTTVDEAWLCPVTRRVLDTAFHGLTPYLTPELRSEEMRCERIQMPRLAFPNGRDEADRVIPMPERRRWLEGDARVRALRERGVWTEFSDRLAASAEYFETAEHSAQQSGKRLRELEDRFKQGDINVLSCSTTMEMGVDIGGLSAVAMNNAPPGPANFLQRAGRAGRRKETAAVTLTLCKAVPHGEAVFRNPMWPFVTPIFVPQVSLQSEPIVQRHINALALTRFISRQGANGLDLRAGTFFRPVPGGLSPAEHFEAWLREAQGALGDAWLTSGIRSLVTGSCLDGIPEPRLLAGTAELMERARHRWRAEWEALTEQLQLAGGPVKENGQAASAPQLALTRQLGRVEGEYLLGELSSLGFLPGYGFPTGVVSFVNTTREQLEREEKARKQKKADGAGAENAQPLTRRRGYPSRDLPVALREYAPGTDVVVDGLVYRSGGVTLNWHIPASDEQFNELQSFRTAWKCQCGATGSSSALVETCPSCGADKHSLRRIPYLEPAGFAVPLSYETHTDLSAQTYVPPRPPWISTGGGPWLSLPRTEAGRFRSAHDGELFFRNGGTQGKGFAICLVCGRAASEETDGPELPPGLRRHFPLRGGKARLEDGQCQGNLRELSVKRHQWLGATVHTDVFELQLADTRVGLPLIDDTTAASLAVALREALAKKLGINERELGWAAVPALAARGELTHSIILYDTASGGAGYTTSVGAHLPELLKAARAIAECPRKCDAACHACLLSYDTQREVERLDRHKILALLDPTFLQGLELPRAWMAFGERTQLEYALLEGALAREMQRSEATELRLYLGGAPADWDLVMWSLRSRLLQWAGAGRLIRLFLPEAYLSRLGESVLGPLSGLASVVRVEVRALQQLPTVGGLPLAAEVGGDKRHWRWAWTSGEAQAPGEHWGTGARGEHCVYIAEEAPLPSVQGSLVPEARLRPAVPEGLRELPIGGELDGPLHTVGRRFWELVCRKAPALKARLERKVPLVEVFYTDRYVRSPLTVRLVRELVGGLAERPGIITPDTQVLLRTMRLEESPNQRPGRQVEHDWMRTADRDAVLSALLNDWKFQLRVDTREGVAHARTLQLRWADGQVVRIRLDEGVGFLIPNPRRAFDFGVAPAEQARRLAAEVFRVERRSNPSPTYLYVSDVAPG